MSASYRLALLRCRDGTRQGDEVSTTTGGRVECRRTVDSGLDATCEPPIRVPDPLSSHCSRIQDPGHATSVVERDGGFATRLSETTPVG